MPKKNSDATDGDAVPPEDDVTTEAPRPDPDASPPPEAGGSATPEAGDPAGDAELAPEERRGFPAMGMSDPAAADAAERHDNPALDAPAERDEDGPHDDEHDDDGGGSFAARALAALVLLLLGIGIGIWGAPRLAPYLPSGLAPVADWLAPDRRLAEDRIVALETELGTTAARLDELAGAQTPDPEVEARIAAAETRISETEARLAAEIAALDDRVAGIDGEEMRQRLSRLESTLQGQSSELAAIKEQLSAGGADSGQSAETAEQIDLYRAEVEGLRAEMGSLSDQVSSLSARIDEVAASSERRVAAAQERAAEVEQEAQVAMDSAAAEADLARIRAAIADGEPFAEPLQRFETSEQVTVPEPLLVAAPVGVATMTELRDRFSDAAHEAIRAGIAAQAGDGIAARSRAFLQSQLASRSLSPQEGSDADAVLSRMEDALRRDDLDAALAEAGNLPHAAMVAMAGWLGDAQQRAQVTDALAALTADLSAMN